MPAKKKVSKFEVSPVSAQATTNNQCHSGVVDGNGVSVAVVVDNGGAHDADHNASAKEGNQVVLSFIN